MKIAIVRVGVDAGSGSGGIQGPLFRDGTFEFIPIPENPDADVIPKYTYGNLMGRHGKPLVQYFPHRRQVKMTECGVHCDPDWKSLTYGDWTGGPKSGLKDLEKGDILIFSCGLQGWDFRSRPGIYLAGYSRVQVAGKLSDLSQQFTQRELRKLFGQNAHVRGLPLGRLINKWGDQLILVKGSHQSRLLKKAVLLSMTIEDSIGRPLKVLSPKMKRIFGDFGGKVSIQRSPTRWVNESCVRKVADFLSTLE